MVHWDLDEMASLAHETEPEGRKTRYIYVYIYMLCSKEGRYQYMVIGYMLCYAMLAASDVI